MKIKDDSTQTHTHADRRDRCCGKNLHNSLTYKVITIFIITGSSAVYFFRASSSFADFSFTPFLQIFLPKSLIYCVTRERMEIFLFFFFFVIIIFYFLFANNHFLKLGHAKILSCFPASFSVSLSRPVLIGSITASTPTSATRAAEDRL